MKRNALENPIHPLNLSGEARKVEAPSERVFFEPFEEMAIDFVTASIQKAPQQIRSLLFASPLSARSSDLYLLWHPRYREKHRLKILWGLIAETFVNSAKGFVKVIYDIRPFAYSVYGEVEDTLLIVASLCGKEEPDGTYKTSYVTAEKEDAVFVFGSPRDFKLNPPTVVKVPFRERLTVAFRLTIAGILPLFMFKGRFLDRLSLLLLWSSWASSLQWLRDYKLEKALSEVIKKHQTKKVGCVHEMHGYSRVVWRVAARNGATGHTVQHAEVTLGKRWFFPAPKEVDRGLALPDFMFVYDQKVADMIRPYYKKTRFVMGCSSRYAHWKTAQKVAASGSFYLFAGALPWYDNEVLVSALKRLTETTDERVPVRLRLHPSAVLDRASRKWIKDATRRGVITLSGGTPLREDIEHSRAVIGIGTTVLMEALLLGRPVVQIIHPDYLQYVDIDGIGGVLQKDFREVSFDDLKHASTLTVDSRRARERLGLDQPVVTYRRLFDPEEDR